MNYFGKFDRYIPDTFPEGFPEDMKTSVIWLRNERGEDLYEVRKTLPTGHLFVTVEDDGSVRVVHDDPNHVWPSDGGHLYALDRDISRDPTVHRTHLFDKTTGLLVPRAPVVPASVSKAQAQIALYNAGLLDQLELVIAGHPYRPVRIWYESANVWERKNPYVSLLGPELDLTEDEIDTLFIEAAKL